MLFRKGAYYSKSLDRWHHPSQWRVHTNYSFQLYVFALSSVGVASTISWNIYQSTAFNPYPSAKQLKNRPNFGASAHVGSSVAFFIRLMQLNVTVAQSSGYSKSSGRHRHVMSNEPIPSVSKTAGDLAAAPAGDVRPVSRV